MPGNSFGRLFKITTFGESHGPGIGVVIDGVPPLLDLSEADIQHDLDRRRPGQSSVTTPRKEADKVEILSGVFEGKTTGAPLALLIRNEHQQSKDYAAIKDIFRPGHADFTYLKKYGIRDYRGGGRSSGRETAARVAAGAIAKKFLALHGVSVVGYTRSVADVQANTIDFSEIEKNPVRCPDALQAAKMIEVIEAARKDNDSVGGVVETIVRGCPVGLGDPAFDKLDALLAHAVMSIGTIKGVEIGDGFEATKRRGSENNDAFIPTETGISTRTNHAGGILGGISDGSEIVIRAAVKPASSIAKSQDSVTVEGTITPIEVHGRHDPCICPRAVPVIEAMVALVLIDCLLVQKSISNNPF
ncbi:MAG: chorismate synthase [Candidatus Margulisiibacteriota bacterium]